MAQRRPAGTTRRHPAGDRSGGGEPLRGHGDPDRPRRGAERPRRARGGCADRRGRRLRHAVRDRAGAEGGQARRGTRLMGHRRAWSRWATRRRPSQPCSASRSPRLAASWLASPTPRISTPCARMPRATPAVFTCPATRAGSARIRAWSTRSARVLSQLDIPALTYGIDVGDGAHAVLCRAAAGGRGVGCKQNLVAGERRVAGKPRGSARAGAQRAVGGHAAKCALEHDRCPDHVRAAAHVRRARARPRAAHRPLHDPGGARRGAPSRPRRPWARRWSRPPTSGRWPTWPALVEVAHRHGVPLIVDEAWGAHLAVPRGPARACAEPWRRPRHLEHAQDRRQPHAVGDDPPGTRRAASPREWSTAA